MHCSGIEHGMTSLSFQTAMQKNEAKLKFLLGKNVRLFFLVEVVNANKQLSVSKNSVLSTGFQ